MHATHPLHKEVSRDIQQKRMDTFDTLPVRMTVSSSLVISPKYEKMNQTF